MDYRRNEDRRTCYQDSPSQGAILDVVFSEESSGDYEVILPIAEVKNFCKIDIDEDDALLVEIQMAASAVSLHHVKYECETSFYVHTPS